jgi:hypothetical protein
VDSVWTCPDAAAPETLLPPVRFSIRHGATAGTFDLAATTLGMTIKLAAFTDDGRMTPYPLAIADAALLGAAGLKLPDARKPPGVRA